MYKVEKLITVNCVSRLIFTQKAVQNYFLKYYAFLKTKQLIIEMNQLVFQYDVTDTP